MGSTEVGFLWLKPTVTETGIYEIGDQGSTCGIFRDKMLVKYFYVTDFQSLSINLLETSQSTASHQVSIMVTHTLMPWGQSRY